MRSAKTEVENVINGRLIRIVLVVVALGAILLGMFSPQTAYAAPVTVYDGPFAMTIPGPCVSTDVITLTGRMVVTFYQRPDGAGGTHITFRTVTKAQGSNQDLINPKNYVMNDENVTDFNAPSSGSLDETQVINQGVIRQGETTGDNIFIGSGDDFMGKTTIHFTVNALGVPTATVTDQRFACM